MLDDFSRPIKERVLTPAALAVGRRVSPLTVTLCGFGLGIAAAVAAATGHTSVGLALWIANRVLDGFDGTLARVQHEQSDVGGYVDLLLDFVVYAAVPIGFVIAAPEMGLAVAGLALLGMFYVNAASWMYLSALLEKRGVGARARGELTSVTMPVGLIGGTETVLLFAAYFIWPRWLVLLFWITTALVGVTVLQRLAWAVRHLSRD